MAFKPSRSKKHLNLGKDELNLNSMMDMMTILLLFLIKNFSTTGQLVTMSTDLRLPTSSSTQEVKKELNVSVTRHVILVGEDIIMEVKDIPQNENLIPPLYTRLSSMAKEFQQDEIKYGRPFTREVIVQADENTQFQTLVKVLYTCGQAEFTKLKLLAIQEQ